MSPDGILPEELSSDLSVAAERVREAPDIRIIAHYDGDGTSAAIILARVLEKLGKLYHISFIKSLDGESFTKRIVEEDTFTIIVDAGSDQIKNLPDRDNVIILDHHFYSDSDAKAININARKYGYNGTTEACGATMAFLFAITVDSENRDLLPFMISGAIADKQDLGGFQGLNQTLIDHYSYLLKKERTINLEGGSIVEGIVYSTDPFFKDLTGNREKTTSFLQKIGIDPEKSPLELTEDEKRILSKKLALRLIAQGVGTDALTYLEADIMRFEGIEFTSKELASIIDGNSKIDSNATAVQYFLGDHSVRKELLDNWRIFKTKLIDYTYRSLGQIFHEDFVNYFYAPESEMAGAICGLLMLYLAPQNKPLVGFNVGQSDTKVSSRATRRMVRKTLNLAKVLENAAKEVGGSGGGHDIAAGAVIPKGKEKLFIETVNRIIGETYGIF